MNGVTLNERLANSDIKTVIDGESYVFDVKTKSWYIQDANGQFSKMNVSKTIIKCA